VKELSVLSGSRLLRRLLYVYSILCVFLNSEAFYADFESLKKRYPIGFLFYFNNKGILGPFLDLSLVPVSDCIQYIHEGAASVKTILLNSYKRGFIIICWCDLIFSFA
jgi:hypothetical protein